MYKALLVFSRKEREVDSTVDSLVISGITEVPGVIRPLSTIWASLKRRIVKDYGVSVTATFVLTEEGGNKFIIMDFLPDGAYLEKLQERGQQINLRLYMSRFVESSEQWISEFEEILIAYVDDSANGLDAFIDEGENPEAYREHRTKFLTSVGLIDLNELTRQAKITEARARRKEEKARRKKAAKMNRPAKPKPDRSSFGWDS